MTSEMTAERGERRRRSRVTWLAGGVGVVGLAALIVVINPGEWGRALTHFDLILIPPIVVCSLAYYVMQGVRWQFLLRDVGAHLPMGETVALNLAGQVTTLLPLGELTRVVLAARETDTSFGDVLATVTVQELIYGLLLVVVAVPGLFEFHISPVIPIAAAVVAAAAISVLTLPPLFHALHTVGGKILGVRRLLGPLDELHAETVQLLQRPDTLGWSLIGLAQVAAMTTVFWLVAQALAPGALTWPEAASVYAVGSISGAISLIPGGLGASEATLAGVLIVAGLPPAVATAVALMQRAGGQGVATVAGAGAYLYAKRKYHIRRLLG